MAPEINHRTVEVKAAALRARRCLEGWCWKKPNDVGSNVFDWLQIVQSRKYWTERKSTSVVVSKRINAYRTRQIPIGIWSRKNLFSLGMNTVNSGWENKAYVNNSNVLDIGKTIKILIDQKRWLIRPRNLSVSVALTLNLNIITSLIVGRRSKNPTSTVKIGLEGSVQNSARRRWKKSPSWILTALEDWLQVQIRIPTTACRKMIGLWPSKTSQDGCPLEINKNQSKRDIPVHNATPIEIAIWEISMSAIIHFGSHFLFITFCLIMMSLIMILL